MFCKKCGSFVENGASFCGKCGTPIDSQLNTENINNDFKEKEKMQENLDITSNVTNENANNNQQNKYYDSQQNYNNIVNSDTKKYAIGSIVIPSIAIIIYWFIGLSVYIAILIATLGFNFAKKGTSYSKILSNIGYVMNIILMIIAIFMGLISIFEKFA